MIPATGHDIEIDGSEHTPIYDNATGALIGVNVTGTCKVCGAVDVSAEYKVSEGTVDGETFLICEHCGDPMEF